MAEQAFSDLTFQELDINSDLKRAIADMEFVNMTPIQAEAIPVLLTGRDIIGQAQTGTGKTAAFGLPILDRIDPDSKHLQAIILCPTRELAVQAANELRCFTKYMHDVKVLPVYGGQDITRQIRGLKGVQVIVGTPGRVMDHMRRHTIKMDHVATVVLDEADEMLNMGFREDMEVILGAIEHPHQTCLFSATMPKEILEITNQYQTDPELIKITKQELTIDRIRQYYYPIKHEFKTLALIRLLKFYQYKKSMVFCNTKSMVDELSAELQKEGYPADGLHGDLTQKQRDSVMGRFRSGSVQILIATDIAARGIDVDDVEAVFNFDIPQETEYYVHRIGRTGRAGREGTSHTLCRSKDFRKLRDIEHVCHTTMEEKRIPNAADIREHQEQAALESVLQVLNEGHSGSLIPVIQTYCEEKGIALEAFAAACLKKELGDLEEADEIDINLPDRAPKKRAGRPFRRGNREDEAGDSRREGRRGRRNDRYDDEQREGRRNRRGDRHDDEQREGRRSRRGDRRDDEQFEGRRNRRSDRRDDELREGRRSRRGEETREKRRERRDDRRDEKRREKRSERGFFGDRMKKDRGRGVRDVRRDGSPKRASKK